MAITKRPEQVSDKDRPFVAARGNADGSVTLYYPGEVVPDLPVPTMAKGFTTVADFLARFTDVELKLWNSESGTDAAVYLLKLQTQSEIAPAGDFVADMLRELQATGIIAKGRAAELSAEP